MSERLLTLAFAAAALVMFYVLMAPKPPARDTLTSRPTSAESRENGYLAARRWLESAGVRVESLRERYDTLTRVRDGKSRFAPVGNLLITTVPHRFPSRYKEQMALREWVEAGNTLLVMASLGDTPEWTMSPPLETTFGDVADLTNLYAQEREPPLPPGKTQEQADEEEAATALQRLPQPERTEIIPAGQHPLFAGVRRLTAESEFPASDWYASVPYDGFFLMLAKERYSDGEAFWARRVGKGSILVSAYASLFTNQLLGEEDNARLLSNIVARSVAAGGAVIFDDTHQGLSALYHPEAFFGDSRLHGTLWLLLALWLIWVLGGTRLRVPHGPPAAPGEAALVRATGGFLARVLKPAQAAGRLFELFFNDLRRRLGEPQDGQPLWSWLERRPHFDAGDLAALREFHSRAGAGRRVDLRKLQTLILRIQEQARN